MVAFRTSDLCDQFGGDAQVAVAPWISYGARRVASGRIACVKVFEDAALVRSTLQLEGEGRILVVDGGGSRRVALFGDNMARLGIENHWAGVVIHGAVRDVNALGSMELAVLALGSVPARGGNSGGGESDVELSFADAVFRPGHFLCIDHDGLVTMPEAPGDASRGLAPQVQLSP